MTSSLTDLSTFLVLAAIFSILGQLWVKQMRALSVATLLLTVVGVIIGFVRSGSLALVEPAIILAGASLVPQIHALVRSRPYRNVLGVTGTLLWCAAALNTWTIVDSATVTSHDLVGGTMLMVCLGIVSTGFAETAAGLLRVGEGKLWLSVALTMTIMLALAPWAGDTSGAPIALASADGALSTPATLTLLYRDMNLSAPVEISAIATGQGIGLGLARTLLIYVALLNAFVLALVALTKEEVLHQALQRLTILTAILAASIPVLSLFPFIQSGTEPQEMFQLAIERLGFTGGNAAVDFGVGPMETLNMHPFGLTPSAALLVGLAASLFVGLGQTREPTIFEDADPGLRWSLFAIVSLGLTLVWAQWTTRSAAAGFGMDRAPWIAVLAALLFVVGTAFTARMGKSSSRLTALGHWLAFAALIVGIIGPGEGWTA
jgi:hypothetical protein